jgi:hypothetical protein
VVPATAAASPGQAQMNAPQPVIRDPELSHDISRLWR